MDLLNDNFLGVVWITQTTYILIVGEKNDKYSNKRRI